MNHFYRSKQGGNAETRNVQKASKKAILCEIIISDDVEQSGWTSVFKLNCPAIFKDLQKEKEDHNVKG